MLVGLYTRVSTTEQAEEGYSIREQEARLRSYCSAKGWTIAGIYSDPGFSGSNTDRPALKDLVADVREKKIEAVLVYKLDRLSRSQKDTLELIEDVFLKNGVNFISISENFDTSTPFGMAIIGILAVFSQLERQQIKERTSIGKKARAQEGLWKGGTTPAGYEYITKDKRLVVVPFEAEQVREIFRLYNAGTPIRSIERIFSEKGYSWRGSSWTAKTIRNALGNVIYIGKIKHSGVVYEARHDPIISQADFDAAAIRLQAGKQIWENNTRSGKNPALLTGLLFCARCGARFHKCNYAKGRCYYACYSVSKVAPYMIKAPDCKNKYWPVQDLDALILSEVKKLAFDPEELKRIKETAAPEEADLRPVLQAEIVKLKAQRSRLLDLYSFDEISLEDLREKTGPINDRIAKIEKQIMDLGLPVAAKSALFDGFLLSAGEIIDSGDKTRIRALLQALIDKIEIDGEDVSIYWKFT